MKRIELPAHGAQSIIPVTHHIIAIAQAAQTVVTTQIHSEEEKVLRGLYGSICQVARTPWR